MALAITQSIVIGAVTMKLLPIIKRGRLVAGIGAGAAQLKSIGLRRRGTPSSLDPVPPPLPEPRAPAIVGQLAGRDFLEYDDGSIEIDTLVGRRRFVSLGAGAGIRGLVALSRSSASYQSRRIRPSRPEFRPSGRPNG